jgi:hypothetical protein
MGPVVTLLYLAAALVEQVADRPAEFFAEVDYAKIDRSTAEEPRYLAEPRYALFILDPAGEFRAWAVLDKGSPAPNSPPSPERAAQAQTPGSVVSP